MRIVGIAVLLAIISGPVLADLQDVKAGGSLRIRGNWYGDNNLSFDKDVGNDALYIEQRTTLNVTASFTDNVKAFVEFDHYGNWGDGFRGLDSDGLLTGADGTSTSLDSYLVGRGIPSISGDNQVNLYQAYVEIGEIWGSPITLRIGRQEISLPSEFLVGNNDTSSAFRGLSFDGITTKSAFGDFRFQTFNTILISNNNPNRWESSGDTYFNGFYGSYVGLENVSFDAFAMRYFQAKTDVTEGLGFVDSQRIYTVGVRVAGNLAQFDWNVEGAYQFGDSGLPEVDGVSSEDIKSFAGNAQAGYTFDVKMQPRVFVHGAYYDGDDEDPAFNRLFSDYEYSEFLDATDMSNVWLAGGGASAQVTEAISLTGVVTYFQSVEDFNADDDSLGFEAGVYATYDYSDELSFHAGYAHFFADDGTEDPQFVVGNGFGSIGGRNASDDLDYAFIETSIRF